MGRSKADRELAVQRRGQAWELYCQSVPQCEIAERLGMSESGVSKLLAQAKASAMEAAPKSREEIAAELIGRWNEAERLIRGEIERQRREGRTTTTITTFADGTQRVEQQHTPGADPALVRALSTHVDRRARQALNQIAPADGAASQEAIRVFLQQPLTGAEWDAGKWNGRMTADEWNAQQEALPERL